MQGAQPLFGLGHEVGVGLKGAEAHRVVYVADGDVVCLELLAEEHVLIAIVAEPLVEGMCEHEAPADEEV